MKLSVLVALVVLIAGGGILLSRRSAPGDSAAAPAASQSVLAVNDLMKNVDRHKGELRVRGVVNAVAPENQSLSLIDSREAKECGPASCCPKLVLPVRWTGAMPTVGQSVQVSGSVQESGGKLLFAAGTLEAAAPNPGESK